MSAKKEMIILEPCGRIRKEAFCSEVKKCPYCGGLGHFFKDNSNEETVPCPDCAGTGEVIAMVTIDWKPNQL